jgi:hypothetical protein
MDSKPITSQCLQNVDESGRRYNNAKTSQLQRPDLGLSQNGGWLEELPARPPLRLDLDLSTVALPCSCFQQHNRAYSQSEVVKMATPQSEYKDRQFLAVIGDEVSC